jgi:MFS family permease
VLANIAALAAIPLLAGLVDRVGRKPVFSTGCLACDVLIFPYLWSISIGSYALLFVLRIVLFGVSYSRANGVWPALYVEMSSARVRLSGMAIGTQIGFAVAGFVPSVVAAIAAATARLGAQARPAGSRSPAAASAVEG